MNPHRSGSARRLQVPGDVDAGIVWEDEDEDMRTGKDSRGFTLIELLVVVAIIGILAAIAIPQFSAYRANSFDAHAVTALNWLAKSEEAYFATQGRYTSNLGDLQSYYPPNGVTVTVTSATATVFEAEASHSQGTRTYNWDSSTGGLQEP
jgi:type IV pilus assembly protein PilA